MLPLETTLIIYNMDQIKTVTNKQRTQINLNKNTIILKLIQRLSSKQKKKLIQRFIICLWDVELYLSLI